MKERYKERERGRERERDSEFRGEVEVTCELRGQSVIAKQEAHIYDVGNS